MLELTGAGLVKPAQKNAPAGVIARPVPLSVYATADGDGWADVWAYEYDYNHRTHGGTVTRSRGTPDGLTLTVALDLQGDPWAPGGPATYEMDLKRTSGRAGGGPAGDAIQGTFTGTVKAGPGPYTPRGVAAARSSRHCRSSPASARSSAASTRACCSARTTCPPCASGCRRRWAGR